MIIICNSSWAQQHPYIQTHTETEDTHYDIDAISVVIVYDMNDCMIFKLETEPDMFACCKCRSTQRNSICKCNLVIPSSSVHSLFIFILIYVCSMSCVSHFGWKMCSNAKPMCAFLFVFECVLLCF